MDWYKTKGKNRNLEQNPIFIITSPIEEGGMFMLPDPNHAKVMGEICKNIC